MTPVSLVVHIIHISIICCVPLLLPTKPFCIVGVCWLTGVWCRCPCVGVCAVLVLVPECGVGVQSLDQVLLHDLE